MNQHSTHVLYMYQTWDVHVAHLPVYKTCSTWLVDFTTQFHIASSNGQCLLIYFTEGPIFYLDISHVRPYV